MLVKVKGSQPSLQVNFVTVKYVHSFLRKKKGGAVRVCKKHKRAMDKFLANIISQPMISESVENGKI